jgi:hypothetical protein
LDWLGQFEIWISSSRGIRRGFFYFRTTAGRLVMKSQNEPIGASHGHALNRHQKVVVFLRKVYLNEMDRSLFKKARVLVRSRPKDESRLRALA